MAQTTRGADIGLRVRGAPQEQLGLIRNSILNLASSLLFSWHGLSSERA